MADPKIYTVGWICAITAEVVAAGAFLDEEHEGPLATTQHDSNSYTRGRMANHNVVIATLPKWEYGKTTAATVARDMLHTFPNIRVGLMVGVGGGVPSHKHDIRLGDVVVASRDQSKGGVFHYDYGRRIQDQPFETTGFLNQPPQLLLTAVASLEAKHMRKGHQLNDAVDRALEQWPRLRRSHSRPPADQDRLFKSNITHPPGSSGDCSEETCAANAANLVVRHTREESEDNPAIHYGLIASSDQLMKDAQERDLAAEKGVLCFEMEAAGLMNHFPCLVVRGICDYSDTHKNQDWQGFAAMMAAAYTKDLLGQIAPRRVEMEEKLLERLESIEMKQTQQLQSANEMKSVVESIRSSAHIEKIKTWLSPPDTSSNSNHARKRRHNGTGLWFLESAAFAEWKTGTRRHMWLYGLAGCGKTTLITTILDHIAQMNGLTALNFFFDFSDTGKQKPENMYRSLVFQLYIQQEASTGILDKLFASHDNGLKQPDASALSKCLRMMLQASEKVCILLDALDECVERKELLEAIDSFISNPQLQHIQLIATGRPEEEFRSDIHNWIGKSNCISLDKDTVNADIQSYVSAQLEQRKEFQKWSSTPKVLQMIRDQVGGKADGMFRWAACQLDSLEQCLDLEELESSLKSLPKDLNATYDRMLEAIPPKRKNKALRLLCFLVHSSRPLTIEEAVDVVAVRNKGKGGFNPNDRVSPPTNVTRFCPSLVVLVESSGKEAQLQLAHFTVKEYLLNGNTEGFNESKPHISITNTCLLYLTGVEEVDPDKIRSQFPLAKYAAEVWMDHARVAEASEHIVTNIATFMQDLPRFQKWLGLHDPEARYSYISQRQPKASSLYYACLKGLQATVREMLKGQLDVNAQGGYYGNALQAAASKGHTEIVKMLVENNADVNIQGIYYDGYYKSKGYPLDAAALQGHTEIVKMLLESDADVNAQGGDHGNALQAAASEGHTEIVKMLLENDADVNAQGGYYGNALQAAALRGHIEIVKMLLESDADVNAQGGYYGNALQAAALRGHIEIVKMLLESDADVNAQGGYYGNALQAAALRGHIEIVKMLLESDADVNAQGGYHSNALQAAASEGHTEIVKMLLDKKADVNDQGGEYGKALYAAASEGRIEIVKMLLENNADVNIQGIYYDEYYKESKGYPLNAAALQGHIEIVKMLLESDADVNAQGGEYGNALQAAISEGHIEIVKMLLESDADVNAQGGEYGNALQAAISEGHIEIVKMLLESDADVNAQGGYYGNALQAAISKGHIEIVKMLLENNADVNTQGDKYSNALQAAASEGHIEIVKMLLEKKADVNAQGSYHGNALQADSLTRSCESEVDYPSKRIKLG